VPKPVHCIFSSARLTHLTGNVNLRGKTASPGISSHRLVPQLPNEAGFRLGALRLPNLTPLESVRRRQDVAPLARYQGKGRLLLVQKVSA
jgi:hypothetical protein